MAWTLEVSREAQKDFKKLDPKVADRITIKLLQIASLENPRLKGHALAGRYAGLWRYRITDYRVIARIEDGRMVIVVVALGHRREVYRD